MESDKWRRMKILPALNELRVPFIEDGLHGTGAIKEECLDTAQPLQGLKILDVGCGGGFLSKVLSKRGAIVTGLDISKEAIQAAKELAVEDSTLINLTYLCSTIEDYALSNLETYDVVVASEVIEHVQDAKIFLEDCIKCLKPGGSIFITTFNKTYASWFVSIILYEYVFQVMAKGLHQWEKFIPLSDIQQILEKYNFRIASTRGLWYNLYRRKWEWISSTNLSYAIQAVKNKNN